MDNTIIARILNEYGIVYERILPVQKGYRNSSYPVQLRGSHMLNLIIYKTEPGMRQRVRLANDFSNYLASQGMPTRQSQGQILKLADSRHVRHAAIYNYLPGETIPWEAYGKNHIKLLGKALGIVHAWACEYMPQQGIILPDIINESEALLSRMAQYFESAGVVSALAGKLQLKTDPLRITDMTQLLQSCRQLPGRQPLHMDFVRGNILFSDVRHEAKQLLFLDDPKQPPFILGILDFEKASYGPPVFDVARTLAFLLVDCKYKYPHKVIKYFVESGYQKRGGVPLDAGQLRVLKGLTRFFLLHDFYKFLRHNPYEYLPQNEHFVRTRDFLLKDGIIKPTR